MKKSVTYVINYKERRDNLVGYMFLLPWLIGFLAFTVFPLFYTFYLSFNEVKLTVVGWETMWIGLDNYVTALLKNIYFTPALIEFLTMEAIYVPAIVIIAFILALLLNQNIKFRAAFRIIYFLPVIVLSGSVMYQLMDSGSTEIYAVNDIFIFKMIFNYSPLLGEMLYILFQNFALVLWFTGIPIVLFINGLQKIERAVYEAAQIDGASAWQALWKITVPMIKPIVLVATLFTIVQLGVFPINPVYDMIRDAIYNTSGGLGLASSYAYLYSIAVSLVIGIAFLILREKDLDTKKVMKRRL